MFNQEFSFPAKKVPSSTHESPSIDNEQQQPFEKPVRMEKPPIQNDIEDYGLIGNCHTACLVGMRGSIDYCCFPQFDSPPIFSKLISNQPAETCGFFSIHPMRIEDTTNKQHYFPDSNVLVTKFLLSEGVGQLVDLMPIWSDSGVHPQQTETMNESSTNCSTIETCCPITKLFNLYHGFHRQLVKTNSSQYRNCIIRRLEIVHGKIEFQIVCKPIFKYGAEKPHVEICSNKKSVVFSCSDQAIILESNRPCFESIDEKGAVIGLIEMSEIDPEKSCVFCLRYLEQGDMKGNHDCQTLLDEMCINEDLMLITNDLTIKTINYWQKYICNSNYQGIFREMVNRSLLALKLLMFNETGAIISSPTTSLPKSIGGNRNYDYRFCWIRDATFSVNAFLKTGMIEDAAKIVGFIEKTFDSEKSDSKPLSNIYTIMGKKLSGSIQEISKFSGFKQSMPVRVGNMASNAIELDIYGELLDSIYNFDIVRPISYNFWIKLKDVVEFVIENWRNPDHSIWEKSNNKCHFVYSKVMSWCCLDRALRLADRRSFPAPNDRWLKIRNEIYEDVMKNGYNEKMNTFVQSYGSEVLDVSLLIMPIIDFLPISDPRMVNTINAINKKPKEGGLVTSSLVYRTSDHHKSEKSATEGTYNMLTFWLLRVLAMMSDYDNNKLRQAQLMFEQISTFSNHVDLYSELTSFSGLMLGNFIHSNTHSSLIVAAVELAKRIDNTNL
ncbi:glycoside hydrolase [Naegleria gruberi]|uniref:Glycoside hydrolase n=1 Tax=Naegleria gruberi TaxID=5762 RepID=D2VIM6_NAEGR|nr:glycoside hydrolase [Naegleria gruberi]EFC43297.1 glycoside hydrolase [Naegleria gruberi]|eukprot:XP_002676041.1 glycoside hydrolase [Naegleria gruberi strain NEG-M]